MDKESGAEGGVRGRSLTSCDWPPAVLAQLLTHKCSFSQTHLSTPITLSQCHCAFCSPSSIFISQPGSHGQTVYMAEAILFDLQSQTSPRVYKDSRCIHKQKRTCCWADANSWCKLNVSVGSFSIDIHLDGSCNIYLSVLNVTSFRSLPMLRCLDFLWAKTGTCSGWCLITLPSNSQRRCCGLFIYIQLSRSLTFWINVNHIHY